MGSLRDRGARAGGRRGLSATVAAALLALTLAGCALAPGSRFLRPEIAAEPSPRAARNLEVFERVWRLVAERHHDPALGGVDWTAAGRRHGPVAAAAADDDALYRELNAMLEPLRDSHTRAISPQRAAERRSRTRARTDRKSTRLNSSHVSESRMPSSA